MDEPAAALAAAVDPVPGPLSEGPLAGLLVLDLTRILAGPTATQLFGDLGADVIKVERIGHGDDTRRWGPPFVRDDAGNATDESAYYLAVNRNKRSLALDLAMPEGQAICREIAARADLALENFKVGGAARLGLDYPSLAAINPRLIYCSITGFGQTGPLASRAGYDFAIQARAGLMSITGQPDDKGGSPTKAGVAVADIMTGMYASVAMLAALEARHRTGRGQYVDLALFDCLLATLANQGTTHLLTGASPRRLGNGHPTIVPYAAYEASDGYFALAVGNDAQFRAFCRVAGAPELAEDPDYATNAARVGNREAVDATVNELTRRRTRAEWTALLDAAGVPVGPINTVAEAFAEPQALSRGAAVVQPHPRAAGGSVTTIGNPMKFSDTRVAYRRPPPTLGQDTRAVLREVLGYDDGRIDDLAGRGVVGLGGQPEPAAEV